MQKLFENWRDFRKDILSEATPDIIDHSPELHTRIKPAGSLTVKELSITRQVLSLVFPPLAIPEAVEAYEQFDKNPSLANAGSAALAMLATVPFIAVPAKAAKAKVAVNAITQAEKLKAAKQVISSAEKTSKAMKGAPQYQQLASKIDDAVIKAKKELEFLQHDVATTLQQWYAGFLHVGRQSANQILILAKNNPKAFWKQTTWRGEGFSDITSLKRRLGLPENYELLATKRIKGWDYIELKNIYLKPRSKHTGTDLKTKSFYNDNPGAENVAMSFSENIETATSFVNSTNAKIKVIYETPRGATNLIDPSKLGSMSQIYRKQYGEAEILGLGPVKIKGFWISN